MPDIDLKGSGLVTRQVIPVMIRRRSGVILRQLERARLRGTGRLSHYAVSNWGHHPATFVT
jgi:hypothetical protein